MTQGNEGTTDQDQVTRFAEAINTVADWARRQEGGRRRGEIAAWLAQQLGDAAHESVVARTFGAMEHVNVQTALNEWAAREGRTVEVRGVGVPPHFGEPSLLTLITGDGPPVRWCAPSVRDLPNGPGTTLACWERAVLSVRDDRGQYVLYFGPSDNEPCFNLEVAGLEVRVAQDLLAEIDRLRDELNVYRGQIVEVQPTPMGGVNLVFFDLPPLVRDDVILPGPVLERLERHALDVAAHRQELRASGQHLKRGMLLYGPPGTGKTHSVRYLLGQMPGYTRLLLQGAALHVIGPVAQVARALQPAVLVLEDVDLVAQDRSFGPGTNAVLFELLDAMDGAAADADLLFLLTTNRAESLERALAARPGRVDVAVAIERPDEDARARLFNLYSRNVPLATTAELVDQVVLRTEGVTASFLKELVRRAVLESLREESPLRHVSAAHVQRALEDLLDDSQQLTRTLLGVGDDTDPDGMTGAPVSAPRPTRVGRQLGGGESFGWFSYSPLQ